MTCKDVKYYLSDYAKGYLIDEMRAEIHEHLCSCNSCTKILDELISSNSKTSRKKSKQIEKSTSEKPKHKNKKSLTVSSQKSRYSLQQKNSEVNENDTFKINQLLQKNEIDNNKLFSVAGVISSVALGVVLAFLIFDFSPNTSWQVEKLSGFPMIESKLLIDKGRIKIGEKLTTDEQSSARLKVGSIGEIDIEPKTEIQISETESFEYNLILHKGKLNARTWAPPKLFSIKTPSSNIKDLGCLYYISVDKNLTTLLRVKSGWVLMENGIKKSILPAGTSCYSDIAKGIGTPFSDSASETFKQALHKIDFESAKPNEFEVVIQESRREDLISLFHLILRGDKLVREKVFTRIAELAIIPSQVTKESIVNGDKEMLGRLWTALNLGGISIYQNL